MPLKSIAALVAKVVDVVAKGAMGPDGKKTAAIEEGASDLNWLCASGAPPIFVQGAA
jgi:hypothetical protein